MINVPTMTEWYEYLYRECSSNGLQLAIYTAKGILDRQKQLGSEFTDSIYLNDLNDLTKQTSTRQAIQDYEIDFAESPTMFNAPNVHHYYNLKNEILAAAEVQIIFQSALNRFIVLE
jgi:hypothetical protein